MLAPNETGYDVVEIDSIVLGDLVDLGLVSPQVNYTSSGLSTVDWHPVAYKAVQVNQATYAFPHLMCAFYLFTHGDITDRRLIYSLAELDAYVNKTDNVNGILSSPVTHRLVGNLDSSWDMSAIWMDTHRDQSSYINHPEAEALHGYEYLSFKSMRTFARLCNLPKGNNPCLNGTFKDDYDEAAKLFANYKARAMFGYSERLFQVLKNGPISNSYDVKIQALPLGEYSHQPTFFTDDYVFRRNLSPNKLAAAQAFVKFMATPKMQAAVVANEAFSTTVPYRYLLPMSKSAYNEPVLRQNRFYVSYFHVPNYNGSPFPNTGVLKTRHELVDAIRNYIEKP